MKKELQLLGLTKNESLVYETLVKHGPSKAGFVIGKLALHRNLIYRALEELVSNGYVTKVVRNGVWHFETTDPQTLLTNERRREKVYRDVLREIAYYKKEPKGQVVAYEGTLSFRRFWLQKLEDTPKGSVFHFAGKDFAAFLKMLGPKKKEYLDILQKKDISFRFLSFEEDPLPQNTLPKGEYRVHGIAADGAFGNFTVTHDAVVLEVFDDHPRIIEVKDKAILLSFRNYFSLMWERAKAA